MSLSSPFNASPKPLNPSPSPYKASNRSINKTSISPKSSANRAQRRTDPHNDLEFRQQGGGPPRGYDRITKAMGKAFDPVLVLRWKKNVLSLWSINSLSISTKQFLARLWEWGPDHSMLAMIFSFSSSVARSKTFIFNLISVFLH